MSVAFSQHISKTHPQSGAPASDSMDLPSVADGDLIVFFAASTGGAGFLDVVSGCGATWVQVQTSGFSSFTLNEMWVGTGVVAAAGASISFDNPANVEINAMAMSFTGATAGVLRTAVLTGTSAAALASEAGPFEAGQAVACGFFLDDFAGGTSISSYTDNPSPWTTEDTIVDGTSNDIIVADGFIVTTGAGAYSRQANLAASGKWTAMTALLSADPFPATPRLGIKTRRNQAVTRAATV